MERMTLKSTEVEKLRLVFSERVSVNGKQVILDVCYGTLIINYRKAINKKPVGIIEDVWTDESFRKKGYGSQLIQELVELAKKRGCYKVILDCDTENVAFYTKLGFKKRQNSMRLDCEK